MYANYIWNCNKQYIGNRFKKYIFILYIFSCHVHVARTSNGQIIFFPKEMFVQKLEISSDNLDIFIPNGPRMHLIFANLLQKFFQTNLS